MKNVGRRKLGAVARGVTSAYPKWVCRREFEQQSFRWINERPVEYSFVFRMLARFAPRTVLDVGTGLSSLPHLMRMGGFLVTAIDNVKDFWPAGMVNRHYHVVNDDIRNPSLRERFDLITCISVLEHIVDHDAAVKGMASLLSPGAHLVMTFPYNERTYVPNNYDLPGSTYGQGAPYVCQSYSRRELDRWARDNGMTLVEQELWQLFDGDYWTVGNRVVPFRQVSVTDKHQHTCVLFRKEG